MWNGKRGLDANIDVACVDDDQKRTTILLIVIIYMYNDIYVNTYTYIYINIYI